MPRVLRLFMRLFVLELRTIRQDCSRSTAVSYISYKSFRNRYTNVWYSVIHMGNHIGIIYTQTKINRDMGE